MNMPFYVINVCEHEAGAERMFDMLIDRHNSFENFPIDNDAFVDSLLVNGFSYTHVEDAVKCEYCGVVIKNWHENDSVEFVHVTLSPYCVYANKMVQNEQFDENASTNNTVIVSPGKPRCVYERMSHPDARRATFESHWPGSLRSLEHGIVEAGMFYIMMGDETVCFFCDCRVRDWLPGDDPWQRHALANPNCYFVKCVKGDEFQSASPRDQMSYENPNTSVASSVTLECTICLERQRDTLLLPCRHLCVCMQCYFALDDKCPTCRQDVTDFLKIFVT